MLFLFMDKSQTDQQALMFLKRVVLINEAYTEVYEYSDGVHIYNESKPKAFALDRVLGK